MHLSTNFGSAILFSVYGFRMFIGNFLLIHALMVIIIINIHNNIPIALTIRNYFKSDQIVIIDFKIPPYTYITLLPIYLMILYPCPYPTMMSIIETLCTLLTI